MDEPLTIYPAGPAGDPPLPKTPSPREAMRSQLRRRLLALLTASAAAFTLTTFLMVRYEKVLGPFNGSPGPANVVRAHLEALNSGELRAAYDLFSQHYRDQVSFEAYHSLVVSHRRLFRISEYRVSRNEQSGERALLDARIVAGDGERYVAHFTLVRADGRWWIDDVHWRLESQRAIISV